jgi:hypothetical protein
MPKSVVDRVRRRREALRTVGLRPVQIWAPDTRKAGFAEECQRQAKLVAAADAGDDELACFLDAALRDVADSGEWR